MELSTHYAFQYNTKQYKTLLTVHYITVPSYHIRYITNIADIAHVALCYKNTFLSNFVVQISNKY